MSMRTPRRLFALVAVCLISLVYFYTQIAHRATWRERYSPNTVGLDKQSSRHSTSALSSIPRPTNSPGSAYTEVLVVARLQKEDVSWIERELPGLQTAIYTVDDPTAPLHPPTNKGHESMVYLTYIVDNYERLPNTVIFIHSHQNTWHNNDLLDSDTALMIRRLSNERVSREGFFNLRCHLHPGCPDWIHLDATSEDINKKEEFIFAKVWPEIHPGKPIPKTLATPCCGQFAASRDRIRSVPLEQWQRYRDWLLKTNLDDTLSGRIWEYTWHYILTGNSSFCPPMHQCYCDGYGVCFGSAEKLQAWFDLREDKRKLGDELDAKSEAGTDTQGLQQGIDELEVRLKEGKEEAIRRGNDPKNRADELGRPWKEGDGF